MKDIQISKPYIIEGITLKEKTIISIQEENDNVGNFLIKPEGGIIQNDEFEKMCQPLIDELRKNNEISADNGIQIQKDIVDLCKGEWARYSKLPTIDKAREYLKTRNQAFAVN
jgi:hypothetical protein